jgi:hypothetical protein
LTVAFSQVPEVVAGTAAAVSVSGTTSAEGVTITDVDLVLARPVVGGRTIVYAHATPAGGDWRAWRGTLDVPALAAGDYPLHADAYGLDRAGKPCYRRATATIRAKAGG